MILYQYRTISELKSYYDHVVLNATGKHIRVGFNEIFPTNYIVTLGLNQDSRVVPGITQWGFQGFKPGQLMINAHSETVEEKKTFFQIDGNIIRFR